MAGRAAEYVALTDVLGSKAGVGLGMTLMGDTGPPLWPPQPQATDGRGREYSNATEYARGGGGGESNRTGSALAPTGGGRPTYIPVHALSASTAVSAPPASMSFDLFSDAAPLTARYSSIQRAQGQPGGAAGGVPIVLGSSHALAYSSAQAQGSQPRLSAAPVPLYQPAPLPASLAPNGLIQLSHPASGMVHGFQTADGTPVRIIPASALGPQHVAYPQQGGGFGGGQVVLADGPGGGGRWWHQELEEQQRRREMQVQNQLMQREQEEMRLRQQVHGTGWQTRSSRLVSGMYRYEARPSDPGAGRGGGAGGRSKSWGASEQGQGQRGKQGQGQGGQGDRGKEAKAGAGQQERKAGGQKGKGKEVQVEKKDKAGVQKDGQGKGKVADAKAAKGGEAGKAGEVSKKAAAKKEVTQNGDTKEQEKKAGGSGEGKEVEGSKAEAGSGSKADAASGGFAGYIFGCTKTTREECFRRGLFGVPASRLAQVERIKKGCMLFLCNFDTKLMEGVFQAADDGAWEKEPDAWKQAGSFPAQVHFEVVEEYPALTEAEFKPAIIKNYYQRGRFNLVLSQAQVDDLLKAFKAKAAAAAGGGEKVVGGTAKGTPTSGKKRGRNAQGTAKEAAVTPGSDTKKAKQG